jgi:hypothetical protein
MNFLLGSQSSRVVSSQTVPPALLRCFLGFFSPSAFFFFFFLTFFAAVVAAEMLLLPEGVGTSCPADVEGFSSITDELELGDKTEPADEPA